MVGYKEDMKIAVTLDRDEDGVWGGECPAIPACVRQGKTTSAAVANIKEAMAPCLEIRAERGLPQPIATCQVEAAV
jgi:predicted RNase H-like HicB family nuclease